MYQRIFVCMLALCLFGCSGILPALDNPAKRTELKFRQDGTVKESITTEKPVLDSQTEYQLTIRKVLEEDTKRVVGQSNAIKDTIRAAITKQSDPTAAALIGVFGVNSISDIKGISATVIAAVKRSKSGYEVLDSVLTTGLSKGLYAFLGHEIGSTVKSMFDSAGDETNINIGGNDNNFSYDKRNTFSTIHANTTGDESPSTVTNEQAIEKCPDGSCGNGETEETEEVSEEGSDYLGISGCSSKESYDACRCSERPASCLE